MLNTYLTYDGNAREAFDFYKSVFGGDYAAFMTYADGPEDMQVADEYKDYVMHVSLPIEGSVLMASDHVPGFGPPLTTGNNFSILIEGRSREHCDEIFAKLSEGGEVTMAMDETFWGAYFGCWVDKFGINWMINYALPQG